MKIQDLTQLLEVLTKDETKPTSTDHPYEIGENYLIRTVTMYAIGKLESVFDNELVLSSASWIPDTGSFHKALKDGDLPKVEPFINDLIMGRGGIIDATIWTKDLPREQKG